MKDQYERNIDYLRLSITDLCNLRCQYCMKEEGLSLKSHHEMMSIEDMIQAVQAAVSCGIKKVRITGGEPLVKKNFLYLMQRLSQIQGIEELCLTTNGILLKQYALQLKKYHVSHINISLDTLNPIKYHQITRLGQLHDVLEGIELACQLFEQVKINVVYMKGFNDNEIDDFIAFATKYKIEVRFIELMPIGEALQYPQYFANLEEVFHDYPHLIPLSTPHGVAKMYAIENSQGKIGVINAMSHSFCHLCNRLRITADGKLKPCLFAKDEYDLNHLSFEEMKHVMEQAIFNKPMNKEKAMKTTRNMNEIGG